MSGLTKHELVFLEEYLRFHQAQDDFLSFCQTHTVDSGFSETCAKAQALLSERAQGMARFLVTTSSQH
jgi:hypothetical protein